MNSIKTELFTASSGEIVGLYGPTGCGKTTLLNKIAESYLGELKISYVFQDSRLIPELSAKQNVLLPGNTEKNWLSDLDIESFAERKSGLLSGGEAQRVNIARAFAWNGDLFLFDEPFSSQDEAHKQMIMKLIKELQGLEKIIVIVSHNKKDLEELNCRVVEM